MDNTVEKLYEQFVPDHLTEQYNGKCLMLALHKWVDASQEFERTLSPEQSKLLENVEKQRANFSRLECVSSFYEGLKLGMRLVLFLL